MDASHQDDNYNDTNTNTSKQQSIQQDNNNDVDNNNNYIHNYNYKPEFRRASSLDEPLIDRNVERRDSRQPQSMESNHGHAYLWEAKSKRNRPQSFAHFGMLSSGAGQGLGNAAFVVPFPACSCIYCQYQCQQNHRSFVSAAMATPPSLIDKKHNDDDDDDDNCQNINNNSCFEAMKVELRASNKLIEAQSARAQLLLAQLADKQTIIAKLELICERQAHCLGKLNKALRECQANFDRDTNLSKQRQVALQEMNDELRAQLLASNELLAHKSAQVSMLELAARKSCVPVVMTTTTTTTTNDDDDDDDNNKRQVSVSSKTKQCRQQQTTQSSKAKGVVGKLRRLGSALAGSTAAAAALTNKTMTGVNKNKNDKTTKQNFETQNNKNNLSSGQVASWLFAQGLGAYANRCTIYLSSRRTNDKRQHNLLTASDDELRKELNISNEFHLRKLRLAINDELLSSGINNSKNTPVGGAKLDYLQVARWLTDIGLPQLRDSFIEARIDGRMLSVLTRQDLISLNCRNELLQESIFASIRVLETINFDLRALIRFAPFIASSSSSSLSSSSFAVSACGDNAGVMVRPEVANLSLAGKQQVELWTNARCAQWLRACALGELAGRPEVRTCGLNGALLMHVQRFTFESLCSVLLLTKKKLNFVATFDVDKCNLLRSKLWSAWINLLPPEVRLKKESIKVNLHLTLEPEVTKQRKTRPAPVIKQMHSSSLASKVSSKFCSNKVSA